MAYEDSFSFGTDIEDVFLDGGYTSPSSGSSSQSSGGAGGMLPTLGKVAGDVLGGIGRYMQGQEAADADEYNAQLALMQGEFEVEKIGMNEGEILSTQKAMYAKAGVESSGSPLDVALHTATNYEYDKQIATFNTQSRANMLRYQADVEKNKGQFGLGMSLLQGATDMLPLLAR